MRKPDVLTLPLHISVQQPMQDVWRYTVAGTSAATVKDTGLPARM